MRMRKNAAHTVAAGCRIDGAQEAKKEILVKIALLVETSNTYARGLLQGIVSYIHEHRPWSIYLAENSRGQRLPSWLCRWSGDGVIARIENASIAATVRKLGLPAVDMSAARLIPSLPWVETDDAAIARTAAQHLLERGFRHFGFVGDNNFNWSRGRELTFVRLVQEAGCTCSVRHLSTVPSQEDQPSMERLGAWIDRLPRPTGIMAAYDPCGKHVLDACRHRGIRPGWSVSLRRRIGWRLQDQQYNGRPPKR